MLPTHHTGMSGISGLTIVQHSQFAQPNLSDSAESILYS